MKGNVKVELPPDFWDHSAEGQAFIRQTLRVYNQAKTKARRQYDEAKLRGVSSLIAWGAYVVRVNTARETYDDQLDEIRALDFHLREDDQ